MRANHNTNDIITFKSQLFQIPKVQTFESQSQQERLLLHSLSSCSRYQRYKQIEALGTTFNVKSYVDLGTMAVTLEEGSVRVDVAGKVSVSEVISPNEQLVYDHRQGKLSKLEIDAELVSKWKEGYLVFEEASFEEIIHTLERRFNVTVNYDIRKYGGGRFSVKYTPYENVRQVLTILETLNPGLKWTIKDNTIDIR